MSQIIPPADHVQDAGGGSGQDPPPAAGYMGDVNNPAAGARYGAILLALALALGIIIGWHQPRPLVWPWIICAGAMLAAALLTRARFARLTTALIAAAMIPIGAAWVTVRQNYIYPDDLASQLGDEQMLVRVEGVATRAPELRSRTAGSMAQFDFRKPATYFPMRLTALLSRDGERKAMRGNVLVRVDDAVAPFRTGDHVRTIGFVLRPAGPRNPGEFDFRRYARSLDQAGILTVASGELLTVKPRENWTVYSAVLNWRDALRRRAGGWLLADLPDTQLTHRDALLADLLLGQRDAQIDGWDQPFQRVGLAHVLAISGFHLSVLAGFVLMLARIGGRYRAWHGWLIIAIVLLYLFLVEVRTPVLRAGVMTIAASLGMVAGRHLRVSGLVAFSALLVLLWRPDQLFNAGFQLTYGVVLGLIHLAPPVRRAWFGERNQAAATTGEMLLEWLKTAAAVSVVAWAVATPIAIHHFGVISPLAAPASLIAVPISAVLLALGYLKIVLAAILPSAALLLGVPLSIGAELLLSIVRAIDAIPFSFFHVPHPAPIWSVLAVAWVCWAALGTKPRLASTSSRLWPSRIWPSRIWQAWESRIQRRGRPAVWIALAALAIWLCWPLLPVQVRPPLRIDMLAVGDGSCYVLRAGSSTVVFDAGSSSDFDAGRRSIIPALRRLGVREIDAIVISHANIDHYSAVIELAREFDVGEVLVTQQFMDEAGNDPLGPIAMLLDELTRRLVAVRTVGAGDARDFGGMRWTWLHPPAEAFFRKMNDASMVIRVEAGSRRALLCGDIQSQAVSLLMERMSSADLATDIIELPHHGSHNEDAELFVKAVNPAVVMQSTGWTRWRRDRWQAALAGSQRLITARDGACWVEVKDDGQIAWGRFLAQPARAGPDAD